LRVWTLEGMHFYSSLDLYSSEESLSPWAKKKKKIKCVFTCMSLFYTEDNCNAGMISMLIFWMSMLIKVPSIDLTSSILSIILVSC
jgi:hypothetical protein